MKSWKTIALAAAFAGAAGLGASVAPVASAQSRTARTTIAPRAEVFSFGGGSRIGVSIRDLESEDLKGKVSSGVLIESVDENSPAAKAGLKTGDIVVEFDGERVRSMRQFTRLVSETPDGRTVTAAVMRDGQRVTMSITPEAGSTFRMFDGESWEPLRSLVPSVPARPATPVRPAPLPPSLESFVWRSGNQLGIGVNDLPEQLAEYFGVKRGVLVTSVSGDSAAAKAGLKAGDVITTFNGETVDNTSELRRRIQNLNGGDFTLGVVRDKKTMTLKGKLEPPSSSRRRTTRTII